MSHYPKPATVESLQDLIEALERGAYNEKPVDPEPSSDPLKAVKELIEALEDGEKHDSK